MPNVWKAAFYVYYVTQNGIFELTNHEFSQGNLKADNQATDIPLYHTRFEVFSLYKTPYK